MYYEKSTICMRGSCERFYISSCFNEEIRKYIRGQEDIKKMTDNVKELGYPYQG